MTERLDPTRPARRPPGEWSPEAEAIILDAVRDLLPLRHAAALAGLSRSALDDHRNADPVFDSLLLEFRAWGTRQDLQAIRGASKGRPELWASRAWGLERTDPSEFGRRDQVQVAVTLAGLVAASMGEGGPQALRDPVSGRFERPDKDGPLAALTQGAVEADLVSPKE